MASDRTREVVSEVILYVSPTGNDAWSGRLAEPNAQRTDGPMANLEAARDAIRRLRQGGDSTGNRRGGAGGSGRSDGMSVQLAGGLHVLDRSFVLTAEDSGSPEQRIAYRAMPGQQPMLIGGREVTNWRKVTDQAVLRRLSEEAREHVLVADLTKLGVRDFGQMRVRGFKPKVSAALELFFDGKPMTLARWPNEGFVTIAGVPQAGATLDDHGGAIGKIEAGFFYDGDRPSRWQDLSDLWVHGYWAYDWANSYERVESLDTRTRLIRTAPPHEGFGLRKGQRYYFLNILDELDSPGEWYLDTQAGLLYFWPPAPIEGAKAFVSVVGEPLIRCEGASYVDIEGLSIQIGRDKAVAITGGRGVRIRGCAIRNIGSTAVVIDGGHEHEVTGCEVCDIGDAGIYASGGDRKTLEPAGHVIEGNHLHRIGRWSKCYVPPVEAAGVGIRISRNLIHDLPHCGILFTGNDHIIEFNEIHHIALETGDVGAIYTGRNWTYQGNIIRHNHIHHLRGLGEGNLSANAVYLDDCASGTLIYGNVFYKVQLGVAIGGGRHNVVDSNTFVECEQAIGMDDRGQMAGVWHDMVYGTLKQTLEEVNYTQPPYSTRYPHLLELQAYYAADKGVPPEGNKVLRNICVGKWVREQPGPHWLELKDNVVQGPSVAEGHGG